MMFGPARQLAKEPVGAGQPPFMEFASRVGHMLPRLDADLRAGGFGNGSRGLAGELYGCFIATIVGARGTEDEAWTWAIARTLADDLAEIGARRGALALLDGLIAFAVNHADAETLQRLQQSREALSPYEDRQHLVGKRALKLLDKPTAATPSTEPPSSAGRPDAPIRESDAVAALRALIAPPEAQAGEVAPRPATSEAPPPPSVETPALPTPAEALPPSPPVESPPTQTEAADTGPAEEPTSPAEAGEGTTPIPPVEAAAEIELPVATEALVDPVPEPAADRPAVADAPSTDGQRADAMPSERREPTLLLTVPAPPAAAAADSGPAEDRIWPALEPGARRSRASRGAEFLFGAATALTAVALLLLAGRDPDLLARSLSTVKVAAASLLGGPAATAPVTTNAAVKAPATNAPAATNPGAALPANPTTPAASVALASANAAPAPAMASPAADISESPPLPGVGRLLSPSEVRYCVFQGRRLTYLRNQIHDDALVQRFNGMVADFNARCGNFRYRTNELREATQKAEARLDQLEADANALASGSASKFGPLVDLSSQQGAGAIQARLKALGFYDHRVDGVWGPNSAAALAAFRGQRHLGPGAVWDLATQWALLE